MVYFSVNNLQKLSEKPNFMDRIDYQCKYHWVFNHMRIIEVPQFGPMFRFADYNVY